tara:strand:- start:16610 stop:17074 length:465 start_codon:yes stop_codon:yes gene_type:complete
MKYILWCIFFIPVLTFAQYDLDTRYFSINAESLPDIERSTTFLDFSEPTEGSFKLDAIPSFNGTLSSIRMNADNFWQPVDMMAAVNTNESFIDKKLEIAPLRSGVYGFSGYTTDGSTSVQNIVYKDARGLNFLDPCPPFGICPRCAHYRVSRGY